VISRLASSLAASVAAQLGISQDAAAARLTMAFKTALGPAGTGPPGSNAERASSLVSAVRRIAGIATGVMNGDTGQPIRTIAGHSSDADTAKASPTPTTDTILRDALAAFAAPASPAPGATSPSAVATPAASDGRTVALSSPAFATATGGDTPLGRILARALLASNDAGTTPSGVSPSPESLVLRQAQGDNGLRQAQGDVVALSGTKTASALVAGEASSSSASQTSVLDSFLQAFAGALARDDEHAKRDAVAAPASAGDASTSASSTASAASATFAAAPTHDASAASPAPASAAPQAQHVDPNAVADQVLRGVSVRLTDGQSEVRLRLVPETLGDISVKLIVSGGSVDASITAHTPEAQNALAGAQTQLAKSFADAGLKLQSFTVGLAGGGFADARDQSRSNAWWTRPTSRRIGAVDAAGAGDADDAAMLATPSFGPPIYTARTLPGAFNHLA
jgi:flagellar hook-length control protein FliK